MELNAEQIKKELEGLANFRTCPEYIKNALALINSQEQRIGELTEKSKNFEQAYDCMHSACLELSDKCDRLTKENERLRSFNSAKCEDCAGCTSWKCDCANIEAYAVEKYKSAIIEYYSKLKYQPTKEHPIKHTQIEYLFAVLDQIAKDMTEGVI